MTWQKMGRIYVPDGTLSWAQSYAHLPTVLVRDDVIRVYYAGLDENKYGHIGYVDLNPDNLRDVIDISPEPVLLPGAAGCFDDSGVNPSAIIKHDDALYLYYIGWQRCERVPYMLQAGLAVSTDNGQTFERASRATILPRTDDEAFFRSAMTVIKHNGKFLTWYPSAIGWEDMNGTLYPVYVVRHASSDDGVSWQSHPEVSIDFKNEHEFGFGRPYVRFDAGRFQMWYSIRSRNAPYRMGYAESNDGIHWQRMDEQTGITASETGWDSEMICYGVIHHINGQQVMFYNGNRHGLTGFGYAVWRDN